MHSVVLLAAFTAGATPRYDSNTQGTRVVLGSGGYNAGTETLLVGGTLVGVPAAQLAGYTVYFNGIPGTIAGGANAQISASIPIGPEYLGVPQAWPALLPFGEQMQASTYVPKPVVMEVASNATQRVIYRHRSSIFDLRQDDLVFPVAGARNLVDGLLAQLTPDGLSALTPVHDGDLPYPDAIAFDAALDAELADVAVATSTPGSVCQDMVTLAADNPGWLLLPAYVTVQATAATLYATQACANDPVTSIRVCVGLIEAEVTDLDVAGVSAIELAFGATSGEVEALVELESPTAAIEVRLRDLGVQYPCGGGDPMVVGAGVAQSTIDNNEWLDEWARCEDLPMTAPTTAAVVPYVVRPEADLELLDVEADAASWFGLFPSWTSDVGTCGQSWINPEVAALLPPFQGDLETALGDAFDAGAPETQEALAFDELFDAWELGTFTVADAQFTAEVREFVSDPVAGLVTRWRTRLDTTDLAVVPRILEPWLFKAPLPYGFDVSPDGLDPDDDPFDASFSVSTTHLNQHLRTKNATDGAWIELAPTYADLGVTPPAGTPDTDPAPLTGNVLGAWFPEFATYGAQRLTITLTPTMSPFVFMDPDAGAPGATPVAFFYPQVRVDFQTDTRPPMLVASVVVDLFDPDLALSLDGSGVLLASVDTPMWYTLTTKTPRGCVMYPLLNQPAFANQCDDLLAEEVLTLVQPSIEASVEAMLDEIVVLERFETPTGDAAARHLQPLLQYQNGMYVRWFGDLVP